jgi:histidyl-tRNA synthetase
MHVQQPVNRLYTIGPMFRHERPQKGRLRQFHQISAEVIGAVEPQVDAEIMAMGQMLLTELGITASLEINSLGCPACRPSFREKLVNYLEKLSDQLCKDCQRRINTNPLRVLDCKNRRCKELVQDAPSILDNLCTECSEHFDLVQARLDLLEVQYLVNKFMVRGLDYYTRTTFEFIAHNLGAQSAVGAGGRYDGLIENLGGPKLPGIGFAMGIERLILLMQEQSDNDLGLQPKTDVFVAALGDEAAKHSSLLVHTLRKSGLNAAMDYSGRSLKAQMKLAGRLNCRYALIIGENELEQNSAVLRNMGSQEQENFSLKDKPTDWANRLKKILVTTLPVNERPDLIKVKI